MPNKFTNVFKSCNIKHGDDTTKKVILNATSDYNSENILFNNVSLDNITSDENHIKGSESKKNSNGETVKYECSFDFNTTSFQFDSKLISKSGNVLDSQKIYTDAIITANGGLDACITIDGKKYLVSDYENTAIDNCDISDVIYIVKTYLAVIDTAEKIKAMSNYKYNKNLEKKGKGVNNGYYITDQTETKLKGKKSGLYRFGFTTFANVGCEVAAAYNCALSLGESERLSETIYYFEATAIELSIGFGKLGSNPYKIGKYLKKRGFKYTKYLNWSKFKAAVNKKGRCRIIMSEWNSSKLDGLHTFFLERLPMPNPSKYYYSAYNFEYNTHATSYQSLNEYNWNKGKKIGFIVGYII